LQSKEGQDIGITVVFGDGAMESGAQDSITPKGSMPKGKTGDRDDFTTICWMELIVDRNQKPVELKELNWISIPDHLLHQ
jgi:hypothetical protein